MPNLIECEEVWGEISNYLDGTLEPSLRERMDQHIAGCGRCKAVLDGTRDVIRLAGDKRAFELPRNVSRRLYSKLERYLDAQRQGSKSSDQAIPAGITDDRVPLGSHLIYFWENDDNFERGVRFLYPGLGQGEHCIVFGHEEANRKVLEVLASHGFDPDELIKDLQLTVLRRQASAPATLSDIGDVVQAALRAGASAVRFLGNLGMGRDPLPAGEDDVLELESKVTALIKKLPCVVVCMYDVRTLSGRLLLKGGLETHHLAVCPHGVQENPYYVPASGLPPDANHTC